MKNYWALIIGGSSGMGLAAAKKLGKEGMNICVLHRDRRKGMPAINAAFEEIRQGGVEVLSFNIDALKIEKIQEVITELKTKLGNTGKIRLLLHAIAKGNLKLMQPIKSEKLAFPKGEDSNETYESLYQQINNSFNPNTPLIDKQDFVLTAEAMAFNWYEWVKIVFDNQLFAADARILGLTSAGSRKAWRGYAAVSVAKAALEAISRAIALEYAPYGIRCNIVQPGVTDTFSLQMIPGSEHLKNNAILNNPYHRLTTPEDVANVIYLLCRDEAAWINGAIIPVDGGEGV